MLQSVYIYVDYINKTAQKFKWFNKSNESNRVLFVIKDDELR